MQNKMISLPVHFFSVTNETKDDRLLKIKIYGVAEGETRNNSTFTLESMQKAIPTVPMSTILAMYNPKTKDVTGHEMEVKYDIESGETYYDFHRGERIIGVIPQDSTIAIEELNGKKWLTYTGYIFSNYNYELKKMLQKAKTKKISVEISVQDSMIDADTGHETITGFTMLGTTILGDKLTTGIADAKLDLLEFSKKNVACFAEQVSEELSKSKIVSVIANMESENGRGESIKVSLTKDSASNTAWGSVDKTKLRNDILKASNYRDLIKACYLLVEEDWEEHPSESLGYPVCQIVGGKLVYNVQGINNAYSRLEGQEDQPYYNSVHTKLMKIRKKLGLGDDRKHIKYEKGGNTLMKEQFEKLFAVDGKYKYISSTEKSVLAFATEDKKFVIIPFSTEEENVVMEEDKAKDAEVYAKAVEPDGDEESDDEKVEMACHEAITSAFVEVDDSKKELEATKAEMAEKDEKFVALEAEKVEMAEKAEMAEKEKETFATEKVEMEAKVATLESEKNFAVEEIKKFKAIQFSETLKDLTRQYKLSTDESKEWEAKFETFTEVKELEVAVVMQSHEKQKQFVADEHINLGGVVKAKNVDKKRAVEKLKELNNK